MSKDYTGTKMANIKMEITLHYKEVEWTDPDTDVTNYYVGLLYSHGMVRDADNKIIYQVKNKTPLGQAKNREWTDEEIDAYFEANPVDISAEFRNLEKQGIDVTIPQVKPKTINYQGKQWTEKTVLPIP